MNDPWAWTTGWGGTMGAGAGVGWRRAKGKNWDNYNRINQNKVK